MRQHRTSSVCANCSIRRLLPGCMALGLFLGSFCLPKPALGQPAGPDTATEPCGFDTVMRLMRETDPNWQTKIDSIEDDIRRFNDAATPHGPTTYTIPVVVHVLHNPTDGYGVGTNISYDQIKWQIQALNAAFKANYLNYNGQAHGPLAVDTQIKFCLATIPTPNTLSWALNPAGQPECGVMRYSVGANVLEHDIVTEGPLLLTVTHPGGEFPFSMYLNIWLVSEICASAPSSNCDGVPSAPPGIVGYATFPGSPGLDGIVFRYDAFGDNSVSGNIHQLLAGVPDLQQGKILAHEAGHYLSLWHTHEPCPPTCNPFIQTACVGMNATTCLTQGDLCCDTPPTTALFFPCTGPIPDTCAETPNVVDQIENYMSYSDDDCMNTFTICQSNRMSAVLNTSRSSLVSNQNLIDTGTNSTSGPCPCNSIVANIGHTPQKPCPGISVCFTTTGGNDAVPWTWQWNFGDPTSGAANTSALRLPCHVFAAAGTYTVSLTVTNARGQTYSTSRNVVVATPIATIMGPSPAPTVCDGSQQCVNIEFTGTAPWTAILTDGSTNYTVVSQRNTICWPVTISSLNPTYSLISMTDGIGCLGQVSGSVTFNVIACCPEKLQNGGFESGLACNITPFKTQMSIPTSTPPCSFFNPSYYAVYNVSAGGYGGWGDGSGFLPNTGNVMMIDGTTAPINLLPAPPHTELVRQNVTILPNQNYMTSFWITESVGALTQVQVKVNNVFVGVAVVVPFAPPTDWNWAPVNVVWNSGTISGIVPVSICQVNTFAGQAHDFALDNISVRQIGNCSAVLCPPAPLPTFITLPSDKRCGAPASGYQRSIDAVGPPFNPTGFITVGERQLSSGQRGLHVVFWNRFGAIIHERLFRTSVAGERIVGTSVDVAPNCDVLIAGEISGGTSPALFAAKMLGSDLQVVWARRLDGDMVSGPTVQADWLSDGSAAITGMGRDAQGNPFRGRLTRLGAAGNTIWSKSYSRFNPGGADRFTIHDLEQAPDGVIWVCGGISDATGNPAMVMPVNLVTGLPAVNVAGLYPAIGMGGFDLTTFTAIKMDPTPGANNGDLLLAGYLSIFNFPSSTLNARAARIDRIVGVAADWDRLYGVSLVPGPSAIGLRRPLSSSSPTDILIAGADQSGHRARTLDIAEANGAPIGAQTHGNSAPPYTTFQDITPGHDRTKIGHIETTAGQGQQVYFSVGGCPTFFLPSHVNATSGVSTLEVQSQNEPVSTLVLIEESVQSPCSIVCTFNPLPGDMDCDGAATVAELSGFVKALLDPAVYATQFPQCDIANADINQDGYVDGTDISPYVQLLTGS